ncbi:MAG: enoyl-CoA hydratase/isomerase family protein [Proteobacteria bacterium]|jgi:enoyl-CoA hydratase|nr:enoyl-CoA hydratase/isomerase family protein [Pseudomonadota bacterium]MDA0992155.1 enoyl-CoA hydratase/isomerase family protein [Pseudomonadota bacterium]
MNLVRYERQGSIGRIELDRPEKLNAINSEMLDELAAALGAAKNDDEIRAIVLSGAGRAFSAGFDLDMGLPRDDESRGDFLRRELQRSFDVIMCFHEFPKPIIAAVHGYCFGSSMELAAVCDITLAAEGCRFGAPEVRFGSGMVCLILPWIIGQKNARELLLVGSDNVSAERAESIGLVNRVVSIDELMPTALAMAAEISLNDPVAVQLTKKALNRSLEIAGLNQALKEALEIDIEIESAETPESSEFNRILAANGPKAALAWRAAQLPRN